MIKILGAVMIVVCGVLLGNTYANILFRREKSLKSLIRAFDYMKTEISYNLKPIIDIIESLSHKNDEPCKEIFEIMIRKLEKFPELPLNDAWKEVSNEYYDNIYLCDEGRQILVNASNFLGKYDAEEQINNINYVIEELKKLLKNTETEKENKGKVYKTGCIAVSVLIAIILI